MRRMRGAWLAVLCAVGVLVSGASCSEQTPLTAKQLDTTRPDGGKAYFAGHLTSRAAAAKFYPIGVWLPTLVGPAGVSKLKSAGVNGLVAPTSGSSRAVIAKSSFWAIDEVGQASSASTKGWLLGDEFDMRFGPGDGQTPSLEASSPTAVCPTSTPCGYSVLREVLEEAPADGKLRYANFGKGVLFWETRAEASRFVNAVGGVVSADAYWYTDDNICSATEGARIRRSSTALANNSCHLAYNYALTVERLRSLVSPAGSRPVWGFVELGHPFPNREWPEVTGPEVRAAAWASIIGGARGIVYFNNSFGGPCPTADVLNSPCSVGVRRAVSATNRQITQLAPVINAREVTGFTRATRKILTTTRFYRGQLYVFAVNRGSDPIQARISFPCSGASRVATVLGENRKVRITKRGLTDNFANDTSVHIYRVAGLRGCRRD